MSMNNIKPIQVNGSVAHDWTMDFFNDPVSIETEPSYNVLSTILEKHAEEIAKGIDNLIANRLQEKGFNPKDMKFLKENLSRIISDEDPFEHWVVYAVTEREVRIISFEREPTFSHGEDQFKTSINYY